MNFFEIKGDDCVIFEAQKIGKELILKIAGFDGRKHSVVMTHDAAHEFIDALQGQFEKK